MTDVAFEDLVTELSAWCPTCLLPSAWTRTIVEVVDGAPESAIGPVTTCESCGTVVGPNGVEVE
jgi:hypothetical protein